MGVADSSPLEENVRPDQSDKGDAARNVDAETSKIDQETSNQDGSVDSEDRPGLIRDDGTINWDCPCLGGMAHGPCGTEFRAAFSCFHYSTAEQKGSDCLEPFMAMQSCFQKYPEIFGPKEGEEDEFPELAAEPQNETVKSDVKQLPTEEKTSVQIK